MEDIWFSICELSEHILVCSSCSGDLCEFFHTSFYCWCSIFFGLMSIVPFLTHKNLFYSTQNSLFDELSIVILLGSNIYLVCWEYRNRYECMDLSESVDHMGIRKSSEDTCMVFAGHSQLCLVMVSREAKKYLICRILSISSVALITRSILVSRPILSVVWWNTIAPISAQSIPTLADHVFSYIVKVDIHTPRHWSERLLSRRWRGERN